jgi:thioredoxin-related protein
MKKRLLVLLFIVNSLLVAESDLSELEIAETISEAEYQKIIENSLSDIDAEYFTVPKERFTESSPVKVEETSILPIQAQENETSPQFASYDEAVVQAKQEDKMILLEVVLDNCKFCDKMDKLVLSKQNVQDSVAQHFIFAQLNADREPLPLGLSEQMSPMFVFISKNENIKDIRFGYIEENDFLNLLVEQSEK